MKGKVLKLGDNINTDEIIPAAYLNVSEPSFLAQHCLEGLDKNFPARIVPGSIIVAGRNFGCGSSREHAPLAIKGAGISCVIAESFARIFYRNSINIGLPILECPEAVRQINEGDTLEVDISAGTISKKGNANGNENVWATTPFPEFMQKIIAAGGLMKYTLARKSGVMELIGKE
jgi:3-isopropylmalate/(R)-2-methylmalate dehydratase small subunit